MARRPSASITTVKTTAGRVELARPLRGTDVRFASRLLGKHVTRTNALESLVIAGTCAVYPPATSKRR